MKDINQFRDRYTRFRNAIVQQAKQQSSWNDEYHRHLLNSVQPVFNLVQSVDIRTASVAERVCLQQAVADVNTMMAACREIKQRLAVEQSFHQELAESLKLREQNSIPAMSKLAAKCKYQSARLRTSFATRADEESN